MKRNYKNKMIKESPKTKVLVCIKECEVPNMGCWKPGDQIKDPDLIELLKNNFNYFNVEEVSK